MNDKDFHITYIEFPAPDRDALAAVQAFYHDVFGWRFKAWGGDYIDSNSPDTGIGFDAGAERVDAPLAVIYASDLMKAYVAVQVSGGNITREIFEFPGGRRFHFADPAGNELAVWSEH